MRQQRKNKLRFDFRNDVITTDRKHPPKFQTKCPTCNQFGKTEIINRGLKHSDECYFAFGYVNFWASTLLTRKQLVPYAMKLSGYSLEEIRTYLGHKYRSQTQGLIDRALARLRLAADFVQIESDGSINYCSNAKLKEIIPIIFDNHCVDPNCFICNIPLL